jgi:hypothetical protein
MTKRRKEGIHAGRSPPYVQIPEEEELRLSERLGTGTLKEIPLKEIPVSGQRHEASSISPRASVDEEEDYPLAEDIFAATTLLIPMSFLLLMMYMWVPASRYHTL